MSCCSGSNCAVADLSCSNGYHPRLEGCDDACRPVVKCEEHCVPDGGGISGNSKCCSGLNPSSGNILTTDGTCSKIGAPICLKCGDGVCSGPEDHCNCPQDCKKKPSCAKEGEIFSDEGIQCCPGLEEDFSIKPCSDGKIPCSVFPLLYSCKKPSNLTCVQECQSKGYLNGYCGGDSGCKSGDEQIQERDLNEFGCMGTPEESRNISEDFDERSWSACCCSGINPATCVKEGGWIDTGDLDSVCCPGLSETQTLSGMVCKTQSNKGCAENGELVRRGEKCCDPSAGIKHEQFADMGATIGWCIKDWDKTCGNGKCEDQETSYDCHKDCKGDSTL